MDILNHPALIVDTMSFWGFIKYLTIHILIVAFASLIAWGIVSSFIFMFYPLWQRPRCRIVHEGGHGAWFSQDEEQMLIEIVEEQNSLVGEGTYWIEYDPAR